MKGDVGRLPDGHHPFTHQSRRTGREAGTKLSTGRNWGTPSTARSRPATGRFSRSWGQILNRLLKPVLRSRGVNTMRRVTDPKDAARAAAAAAAVDRIAPGSTIGLGSGRAG